MKAKRNSSVASFTAYGVAIVAGVLAGLVGTAFRLALGIADALRIAAVDYLHQWPWIGWIAPVLVAAGAVAFARYLVIRVPEAAGSGVQRIEASVRQQVRPDRLRVVPAKFVGGVLAIGSGLALGREGPTVQMSAAIGSRLGRATKVSDDDALSLQAALAGAGLGVAFNAPLGGVIFVVEELTKTIRMKVIGLTLLATSSAVAVMRLLIGSEPDFLLSHLSSSATFEIPIFIIFGFVVGILGAFYSRTIVYFLDLFERYGAVPLLVRAAIVGGIVGLIGWFAPRVVGGGDDITQNMLSGSAPLLAIAGIFVLRWFLGPLSYSVATPGGLFAPLLVLGACFGALVGGVLQVVTQQAIGHPIVYALVGMSAIFGAVVRAPITGIVLVVEMTATSNQFVPLMLGTAAALVGVGLMGTPPIYDTLRHRLLNVEPVGHESR